MAVRFGSSSSIKGSNEMLGCESLPLSCAHSINDGALRCCHITREEEASRNVVCQIVNRRLKFSNGSWNHDPYNSLNGRPWLIRLINWIIIHSDAATYPPHLNVNEGLGLNVSILIDWTLVSVPRHMCNKINKHSPTW